MENYIIEIVGVFITILTTLIVANFTRDANNKIQWGITFSWLLIGLLITSHINTRILMHKNQSVMDFYAVFKDNPESVTIAKNDLTATKAISEMEISFFENIFLQKRQRYNHNLENISDEEIKYNITNLMELGEMQNDAVNIFENASNRAKVRATSYVNVEQWWTNEFGEKYEEANKSAVERGVEISRIWIFKDKMNYENRKEILEEQKKLKINTYYLFEEDIQHLNESKVDVILVEDQTKSFYGELELNPLRKMLSVNFGGKSSRMLELEEYWSDLLQIAKPYK
jgi:hypothetical protein